MGLYDDPTPPPADYPTHRQLSDGTIVKIEPPRTTKLRQLLIHNTKPQYVVAGACRIHPVQLSYYALGRKPISHRHLVALCEYFQKEPEDIIGYVNLPDIVDWIDQSESERG